MAKHSKPVRIFSATLVGVDALPIEIEATAGDHHGAPRILGSVDAVVREAYHRVQSAFRAEGLPPPRGTPTLNFSPADVRKGGAGFDLPMALALACAAGALPPDCLDGLGAAGELALDGRVLPVRGAVAMAVTAREQGWHGLILGPDDAAMAAVVPDLPVYGIGRLRDAILGLAGETELVRRPRPRVVVPSGGPDLIDIRGHQTPKRALTVAAAGGHNLLFVGPPGSGKSALLRRLSGLLPEPSDSEWLEILRIHSISGSRATSAGPGGDSLVTGEESPGTGPTLGTLDAAPSATALPEHGVALGRPLRAPHHTSSYAALLGGGSDPRPGEVTLAQHGTLFLDELAEFRREALEGLRQPLEERQITIGRARHTVVLPADFLLVAAMNPCACGYRGHPTRHCTCSPGARQRYIARVSGPLLDRIDLQVEVPALDPAAFRQPADAAWSTAGLRQRVLAARERQRERNRVATANGGTSWVANGRLQDAALDQHVRLGPPAADALDDILREHGLSGRARVRLLRVARTLADLDDSPTVEVAQLLSAARLRGVDRLWHED